MIKLLPVHLINPGTELVMCVCKRKNVNYTDEPLHTTCKKCIDHYDRNVEWWAHKLPQETNVKNEIRCYGCGEEISLGDSFIKYPNGRCWHYICKE